MSGTSYMAMSRYCRSSNDPKICSLRAALALARVRHPDLRAQALTLLAQVNTLESGLILLVANHAPADYAMLVALPRS